MAGIVRQEFFMNTIKKLGYYSNSENGVVISAEGISHCISGGGKGHDTDVPKILIEYD